VNVAVLSLRRDQRINTSWLHSDVVHSLQMANDDVQFVECYCTCLCIHSKMLNTEIRFDFSSTLRMLFSGYKYHLIIGARCLGVGSDTRVVSLLAGGT
jgi:hypothetical protein